MTPAGRFVGAAWEATQGSGATLTVSASPSELTLVWRREGAHVSRIATLDAIEDWVDCEDAAARLAWEAVWSLP